MFVRVAVILAKLPVVRGNTDQTGAGKQSLDLGGKYTIRTRADRQHRVLGNPELRDFAFDVHAARIEVAPQRVAHLLWLFTARAEL